MCDNQLVNTCGSSSLQMHEQPIIFQFVHYRQYARCVSLSKEIKVKDLLLFYYSIIENKILCIKINGVSQAVH